MMKLRMGSTKTQNVKRRNAATENPERGTQNPERGTENQERETILWRNRKPGTHFYSFVLLIDIVTS